MIGKLNPNELMFFFQMTTEIRYSYDNPLAIDALSQLVGQVMKTRSLASTFRIESSYPINFSLIEILAKRYSTNVFISSKGRCIKNFHLNYFAEFEFRN